VDNIGTETYMGTGAGPATGTGTGTGKATGFNSCRFWRGIFKWKEIGTGKNGRGENRSRNGSNFKDTKKVLVQEQVQAQGQAE